MCEKEKSDYLRIQNVMFAACFGFQFNFRHRSDLTTTCGSFRGTDMYTVTTAPVTMGQFLARISK